MRTSALALALLAPVAVLAAEDAAAPNIVSLVQDEGGWRLLVDGEETFLFGMNWGYVPVGTNYSYDFWSEDEAFIEAQLRTEMALLTGMGVNTIRQYPTIPPKWVAWIYDNYGVYTLINPLVGRYGTTVDGVLVPDTNYADPRTREVLIEDTLAVAESYKNTRGLLGYMLGNEANYGLSWDSFEIQALPKEERQTAKARALYSLYGAIIDQIHATDPNHPVAICNGDVQYIDVIAEEAPNVDIFATNVYRGRSARDLFEVIEEKLNVPMFFSEFGADAYDAKAGREDHITQATYLRDQWKEIYLEAHGNGRHGNVLGGYIFQWSDGWWKFKQETNLDIHDNNASWPNKAYIEDFVEGDNNMNEEWFGITAKVPPRPDGSFDLLPRSGYFLLRDAFELHPYQATPEEISAHFDSLQPSTYAAEVAAFKALGEVKAKRVELSVARVDLSMTGAMGTYKNGTGAANLNIDHTQSIYLGGAVRPVDNLRAEMVVNVLGNVSGNPIDNIRYENRGARGASDDGIEATQLDRVQLYASDFEWNTKNLDVRGFYRTGHYHWGFKGDLFGLYPEANYGPNLDIYNGVAPIGVELEGKKKLDGFGLAVGPQLWWGANPAALVRASRKALGATWTLVHHEDLATQGGVQTSAAVSEQVTRRTALAGEFPIRGGWTLEMAGLFAGSNKVGQPFTYTVDAAEGEASYQDSGVHLVEDVVRWQDTFGGKIQLSRPLARTRVFIEGAYQGLVADGGYDTRRKLIGWTLGPSGRGNHWHATAGMFIPVGSLQIAPNMLVQRPLIGPQEPIGDTLDPAASWYYPGVNARNFRDDPFAVLDNRETYGAELLLVWDPTPGSYFFEWDNLAREDAGFAASLDFVYRHQPTVRDANFGFTADGALFAFPGSPPATDEWMLSSRMMVNAGGTRLVIQPYVGQQQARGIDDRLVTRAGADFTLQHEQLSLRSFLRFNDWGPYDFHRDFNFTFPVQMMVDLSSGVGAPRTFLPSTRFGIRGKVRTLDQYSVVGNLDRNPGLGNAQGWEGEIFTYVQVMK